MAGNALPILLIGGAAALMLAGGKKKKASPPSFGELKLEPTTPPPLPKAVKASGSGYPGVTRERMQEIQTMLVANGYDVGKYGLDGKYGPATKQAVWEFQEDWGGLQVDGKPGPKTQAALEEAEAARLQSQQQQVKQQPQKKAEIVDECDPLDPGTWGSGNICVFDGTKWARRKGAKPEPKAPTPEPLVSARFLDPGKWAAKLPIGNNWYSYSWLPNNVRVRIPDPKGWYYRMDWQYVLGGKVATSSERMAFEMDTYDEGVDINILLANPDYWAKAAQDYYQSYVGKYFDIVRAIRNLAMQYPNIGFSIQYVPPTFAQGYSTFSFGERKFLGNVWSPVETKSFIANDISTQQLVGEISDGILKHF